MARSNYSIQNNDEEYQAQDFWTYVGLKYNSYLSYLQPILEEGATIVQIHDRLLESVGSGDPNELYWEWAKNQAFERTIDYDNPDMKALAPCELNTDVIALTTETAGQVLPGFGIVPFYYHANATLPVEFTFNLKPLTSLLIRLDNVDGFPPGYHRYISGAESDPEIRYKVYEMLDIQAGECGYADGDRLLFNEPYRQTADTIGYVLVSNTSYTEEKTFKFVSYAVPE